MLAGQVTISRVGARPRATRAARAGPGRALAGPGGVPADRAVVGAPAVVSVRPMAAPPGARGGAGCPNLLQRPRSSRDAGRGSLIFRASSRGRSRPGAPLQQIWTSPRPRPPQEPHTHHRDPLNPCSRRQRSRRCTAAVIRPDLRGAGGPRLPGRRAHRLRGSGLQGAEVRKVHPHSSLHSHYYQQHRHRRTVALYCHGPVARQGVRSREKVAPACF